MANATNSTKVTIKDKFALVKAFLVENGADASLIEFIEDRAEKSVRKASTKPNANQIANEGIKADILATLSATPMSITEIQKSNDALAEFSTSKMSALLNQLIQTEKVVKTYDKKKAYFSLA